MKRVALDANILAYLAGISRVAGNSAKIVKSRALLATLSHAHLVAPAQTLGELMVVLRRVGATAAEARDIVLQTAEAFDTVASDRQTVLAAADLTVDHQFQFWDALIATAAADAGCRLLLSEDMQHGFVVRGLTIVNPFVDPQHPKLAALLADAPVTP